MKHLLTLTAIIEAATGLALIAVPSFVARLLLGVTLETPAALTVARIAGAALLAIGLACWLARDDGAGRAGRALLAAITLYDAAAAAILAFAGLAQGPHGIALWPAVVLHAAMTFWCIKELLRKPA